MAQVLRQSTAVDILIGPFVDSGNGDTEETALTIEDSDVRISKNGQNIIDKNDVTDAAHDEKGMYNCELDATDTDTVGQLTVYIHVAGALAVRHDYQVIEEDAYDWMFASGAAPDTQVAAIPTTAMRGTDDVVLSGPTKAEMDTAHALLATPAQVATALTDIDLDHLTKSATSMPTITAGTYMDQMFDDGTAVYDRTTDSLQAVRDRGDSAWVTATGFALASVLGALNDVAAAGEVTTADTLMQYLKQLLNIIAGAPGVGTQKAAAAPGDGVSMSEVIRAIYDDTNAIQGKLPTNKFMGSSDGADDDSTLNSILSLLDDARAEPGQGAPPVNPDLATKIDYLYKFLRNKIETTATEIVVYDNAGTTKDQKSTISDDATTFTRGEFGTGA